MGLSVQDLKLRNLGWISVAVWSPGLTTASFLHLAQVAARPEFLQSRFSPSTVTAHYHRVTVEIQTVQCVCCSRNLLLSRFWHTPGENFLMCVELCMCSPTQIRSCYRVLLDLLQVLNDGCGPHSEFCCIPFVTSNKTKQTEITL